MQGQTGVIAGLCAAPRRLDRLPRRREHRQHAVAQRRPFDRRPRALRMSARSDAAEFTCLCAERGVAEAFGEGGRVRDVGEEDDGGAVRQVRQRSSSFRLRGETIRWSGASRRDFPGRRRDRHRQ